MVSTGVNQMREMNNIGYLTGLINTTLAKHPELVPRTFQSLKKECEAVMYETCAGVIREANKSTYGKKSKWDCELWRSEPMFSDTCGNCSSKDVCEL